MVGWHHRLNFESSPGAGDGQGPGTESNRFVQIKHCTFKNLGNHGLRLSGNFYCALRTRKSKCLI